MQPTISIIEIKVNTHTLSSSVFEQFIVDTDMIPQLQRVQFMRMPNNSLLVSHIDDKYITKSNKLLSSRSLSKLITGKERVRKKTKNVHDISTAGWFGTTHEVIVSIDTKIDAILNNKTSTPTHKATAAAVRAFSSYSDVSSEQKKMIDNIYKRYTTSMLKIAC